MIPMTVLLGWLAALTLVVLLIGVPLALGRLLADRDRAIERVERSALEAEALALMVGQPVVEASPAGDDWGVGSGAGEDGQGSSPM